MFDRHWLRFSCPATSLSETVNRTESVPDAVGNEFISSRKFECSYDPSCPLVALIPAQVGVDHGLTTDLQSQGAKFEGQSVTVNFFQRSDALADRVRFGSGCSIRSPVIPVAMPDVSDKQFVDRQIVGRGKDASVLQPLGDQAVVLRMAGRSAVYSEIKIASADCDDGLPGRFVETVRRSPVIHGAVSQRAHPVNYRICRAFGRSI
jgi:hypothetical protein